MKTIFPGMRTNILATFALMGVFVIGAFAADVTGKYVAEVQGQNGTQQQTFDLKADGGKVTGTVSSPRGEQKIEDGKVDGDTISFTTTMKRGDMEMKMSYTGKIADGSIEFNREMNGGPGGGRKQTFTAKKQ
jgi:hypothetical protein